MCAAAGRLHVGACSAALSHAWQTCQPSGAGLKPLSLVVQQKHSHCRQNIGAAKHYDAKGNYHNTTSGQTEIFTADD